MFLGIEGLTMDMVLVLVILIFTTVLFISDVVRVDVVAIMVLVALGVTKLLSPEQLFSGFSSEAVISLIAIMIISAGLENTGISLLLAKWMLKIGKERPRSVSVVLMSCAGILASFMRSLGTVALFLPIISRINSRTGIAKAYLLLPMAFSAILGGMLTMVGSGPLIVLNSLLKNFYQYVHFANVEKYAPFGLFDVLPIGIILLSSGILYLIIISPILSKNILEPRSQSGTAKSHLKKIYGLGGDLFELKVTVNSPLVGHTLNFIENKMPESFSVLAIMKNKDYHFPPLRKTIIKAQDSIAIMGDLDVLQEYAKEQKLKLQPKLNLFSEILHSVRAGASEVVIPPSSQLIGTDIKELHMRRNHNLHVLALRRGNNVYHGTELQSLTLRSGDTLGIYSTWIALSEFQKNPDFFVLTTSFPKEKIPNKKMLPAIFFFLLAIGMVVIFNFPISVGLFFGAVGMIATKVISIDQAYSAVSWKTVFLLAGLIPLGLVMQTTGTTEWLMHLLLPYKSAPIWFYQIFLAIISTILALIISNIGATVLLVPVAFELAVNIGAEPRIFALTVAIAASNTFLIPTHQVNALIAGPGGYSMADFLRVGGMMTLIFWFAMLLGFNFFF